MKKTPFLRDYFPSLPHWISRSRPHPELNETIVKPFLLLVLSLFVLPLSLHGQTTKIRGHVKDAQTGEPIPFASLTFPGLPFGTSSDNDGNYYIETREKVTEITAIMMSYEPQTREIATGTYNEVNFELSPSATELEAIVIRPGENPAFAILRNVSANKYRNDPDRKQTYRYDAYTKMEVSLSNIKKEEFRNKKLQKNFGFMFDYVDTSALTGRTFLPFMISETSSENYFRRSPRMRREIVNGSRISGIEQDFSMAQFTGGLHVNVNLYENYINILEVNFPSPLCEHGTLYYDYHLVDSARVNGRKEYLIRFYPKNKATAVFEGEVHIDSLTWGLRYAKMRMPRGVNVNWIKELLIENENRRVQDSIWFPVQDKITAEFSLQYRDSSDIFTFLASRQIDYSNIRIDEPIPAEVAAYSTNVVYTRDVLQPEEEYWEGIRPYPLSEREQGIYTMVDAVKDAPLYKTFSDVLNTLVLGFYPIGKIELGPFYKLYSFNKMEGNRFQLGVRTTGEFSKKIRLYGYLAYGTKDDRLKGGGSVEYLFDNLPTNKITLAAKKDVTHLGASENAFTTGNIFGSLFSRRNNDRLTLVDQYSAEYEREWHEGYTNFFRLEHRRIYSNEFVAFRKPDGSSLKRLAATEAGIGFRFTRDESVIRRDFEKQIVQSPRPVFTLRLNGAVKEMLDNDYNYLRTELDIKYSFNIPPLGKSQLLLSGGHIFGKVPYPFLKLHEGNATYFYDPLSYSCMHFYEFASDLWGGISWEHHFRGFFLGRIPLLKRLQLREVVTAKTLWGRISDRNNGRLPDSEAYMLFPEGMTSLNKPYVEAGVGIENIFRLFRVDAIWRLTHRDNHDGLNVDNFAVNFSFALSF